MKTPTSCPCGSGETYLVCCGPFHSRDAIAPTATSLMRSRFCAFALADESYLLDSWHPSTRPSELHLDQQIRWTGLDIVESVRGGLFDATGVVEFRAHYQDGKVRGQLHERSTFVRELGQWLYRDGEMKHQ